MFYANIEAIKKSVILSAATMLSAISLFFYQFAYLSDNLFTHTLNDQSILLLSIKQSVLVFCIALLSSLVGFLYCKKLHLPGWGSWNQFPHWFLSGLMMLLIYAPCSYWLIDRHFMAELPNLFPHDLFWAMSYGLSGAINQEVILRFGLLTILLYFYHKFFPHRYPWGAITLISLFACSGSYILLKKFHLEVNEQLLNSSMVGNFFLNWLFCHLYIRYGLLVSITVHSVLNLKYVLYVIFVF